MHLPPARRDDRGEARAPRHLHRARLRAQGPQGPPPRLRIPHHENELGIAARVHGPGPPALHLRRHAAAQALGRVGLRLRVQVGRRAHAALPRRRPGRRGRIGQGERGPEDERPLGGGRAGVARQGLRGLLRRLRPGPRARGADPGVPRLRQARPRHRHPEVRGRRAPARPVRRRLGLPHRHRRVGDDGAAPQRDLRAPRVVRHLPPGAPRGPLLAQVLRAAQVQARRRPRRDPTVIVDDVNADCETVHRPGLCDGPLLAWRAAAADGLLGDGVCDEEGFCVATCARAATPSSRRSAATRATP